MEILSSDDLAVLESVFKKYDFRGSGYLDIEQFTLFLVRLGKHVKELKKVSSETTIAVFALIDRNTDGKINFNEFCEWWSTDESRRYGYFTGEKKRLLRKSYDLYRKYSSNDTSITRKSGMTLAQFGKMMNTLKIEYTEEDFDALDEDDNGTLSFEEFCRWLNWF